MASGAEGSGGIGHPGFDLTDAVAAPSLSVVTLLWRNEDYSAAFLTSLSRAACIAGVVVEVIALKNGPEGDAAHAALAELLPIPSLHVRFLISATNLGFAGGMNVCSAAATGDAIVVANLDLEFDDQFVRKLRDALRTTRDVVLLAPSVLTPIIDGPAGAGLEEAGALRISGLHRLRTAEAPREASPVPAGNGSCVIVPRSTYELRQRSTGGLFDPEYHAYFEDVDLFWWARDNEIPVIFLPDVRVLHHHAGSFGGKYRFNDRTPDVQASVLANYRLTVWKHAQSAAQVAGWVAGEAGYLYLLGRARRPGSVGVYLASWRLAMRRTRTIRARRGRLRDQPPERGPAPSRLAGPNALERCLGDGSAVVRDLERVLLVIPREYSYDAFLREIGNSLAEQGVEVHCACDTETGFGGASAKPSTSTTMHQIRFPRGMSPWNHLQASRQLAQLVEQLRPDLVHAHFSAAIFTTALAKRGGWPTTMGTYQGLGFALMGGAKGALVRRAEVWASERLDEVWVLTADDRQALQQAAPVARVRQSAAPGFGCDLERFDPSAVPKTASRALRDELGLNGDEVVFTFVGRFVSFKGFGATVEAFLSVAAERPNLRLLLLGTTDPLHATGLTAASEEAMARSPQVIQAGFVDDVERYLAISDVVVFPSQREGMAVCLMESLAMGVPVITADARGCRDVVRDGVDGIVLPVNSPRRLHTAMERLADDNQIRSRLAANALAGRQRFDRQHYVDEQVDIYSASAKRCRT